MTEIPVVTAAAARSADGGHALAAIGVGMSILVVVNTPALAVTALVVMERDGRRCTATPRRSAYSEHWRCWPWRYRPARPG